MWTIRPDRESQGSLLPWTVTVLFIYSFRKVIFIACLSVSGTGFLCSRTALRSEDFKTRSLRRVSSALEVLDPPGCLRGEGDQENQPALGPFFSCPCLTHRCTVFSSFSFHPPSQEPFHNDLPTVISLLKAMTLGSWREAGRAGIEPSALWVLWYIGVHLHWGHFVL